MKPKSTLHAFPALLLLFAHTAWAVDHLAWSLGTFNMTAPGIFCSLDYGITCQSNSDGNIVILGGADPSDAFWSSSNTNSHCNGAYQLFFQNDGNLVTYDGSQPIFSLATTGRGVTMAIITADPFWMTFDATGWLIWHANTGTGGVALDWQCLRLKRAPWDCI